MRRRCRRQLRARTSSPSCSAPIRSMKAEREAALQPADLLSNHDAGRFAMFVAQCSLRTRATTSCFSATCLRNAMLLTLRGVPTIYSGDEQGFVGKGGDQDARQDMFASQGRELQRGQAARHAARPTAQANFNPQHPLYREIAAARAHSHQPPRSDPRSAARSAIRRTSRDCSPCRASIPATGREMLLLFNTSTAPIKQNVRVETRSTQFEALAGTCPLPHQAPGSVAGRAAAARLCGVRCSLRK